MKVNQILFFVLIIVSINPLKSQTLKLYGEPELFAPGIISTEKSEIKITFSDNGNVILWGVTNWEGGYGGWDIWKSIKTSNGLSQPKPVSFNSKYNDFDPYFTSNGDGLYFFSNRPGGFCGDDLYYVSYNPDTHTFGSPINLGTTFNTSGDEWGPSVSKDGNVFIYCADGFEGTGKHDIYISNLGSDGWSEPENLKMINSSEDDFDPVFLHDSKTIIFSRKTRDKDEVLLYISYFKDGNYSEPEKISNIMSINDTWNFAASIDPTDITYIYYTSHIESNSIGLADIYRIKYQIEYKK